MLKKALIGLGVVLVLVIAIVAALGLLDAGRDLGQPDLSMTVGTRTVTVAATTRT